MKFLVACLVLSGLPGCARFQRFASNSGGTLGKVGRVMEDNSKSFQRADEMKKDCDALRARTVSFEEETAFGGAVSVNWVSQGGGLTNRSDARALHVQLNKIGKNLAAQSSRPNLPWTFGVLQSEGVNAVSGPGGYVFVSEGLLARLDNEAQLAGVLAHEIAHITGKHAMHEYQRYLVKQCEGAVTAARVDAAVNTVKGIGSAIAPIQLPPGELRNLFQGLAANVDFNALGKNAIKALTDGFVSHLLEKGFDTDDEYAADLEAVELMAAAGYAPEEYVAFLSKLPDKGLSTEHPRKEKRQERLRKQLAKWSERAPDDEFTTSVDLSQTKVVPLRDALQAGRTGTASRGD
ncbi:M48 family metalloprotease [Archangium violaceum]|uniref:M48 family metalloprotease n=1 Tax=Archangium violaceum TaxID=83451 RepID=UPI00193B6335|nr:M48 family metalloprotease [Archangium violaceum]QRK09040.1 M48 family metalloprotease [Archangium violaceum]